MLILIYFVVSVGLTRTIYQGYIAPVFQEIKSNLSPKNNEPTPFAAPEQTPQEIIETGLKNILTVKSITKVDEFSIQVNSEDNLVVLFRSESNLKEQINSLQTILTQSRIEKRSLKKIDLRFSKIAIEYN